MQQHGVPPPDDTPPATIARDTTFFGSVVRGDTGALPAGAVTGGASDGALSGGVLDGVPGPGSGSGTGSGLDRGVVVLMSANFQENRRIASSWSNLVTDKYTQLGEGVAGHEAGGRGRGSEGGGGGEVEEGVVGGERLVSERDSGATAQHVGQVGQAGYADISRRRAGGRPHRNDWDLGEPPINCTPHPFRGHHSLLNSVFYPPPRTQGGGCRRRQGARRQTRPR